MKHDNEWNFSRVFNNNIFSIASSKLVSKGQCLDMDKNEANFTDICMEIDWNSNLKSKFRENWFIYKETIEWFLTFMWHMNA